MKTTLALAFVASLAAAPTMAAPVLSFDMKSAKIKADRYDIVEDLLITKGVNILRPMEGVGGASGYEIIVCNVSAPSKSDTGRYDLGSGNLAHNDDLIVGRCIGLAEPQFLNLDVRNSANPPGRPWTARVYIRRIGSN